MNVNLGVLGYAAAGVRAGLLPPGREVALPAPGFQPRRARLPDLALALARAALAGGTPGAALAVYFGTAFGSATETQAFVDNLIARAEAEPMPRAFTASVHNAAASRVAQELGARGECQTFAQGETSFAAALLALALARPRPAALAGAADEVSRFVERANQGARRGEGGGMLWLAPEGGAAPPARPLARIVEIALGATREPDSEADAELARRLGLLAGDHPAAQAAAAAFAVAILAGEVDPAEFGLDARPRRIALSVRSRLGDSAAIVLEAAP